MVLTVHACKSIAHCAASNFWARTKVPFLNDATFPPFLSWGINVVNRMLRKGIHLYEIE